MTPRTFRFGQRGTAPEGEAPDQLVLTPQDEENIHAYVSKIHDTIDVLNREVDAIKAGNLDVVSAIFDEKSRALKWLELQTPLVEPFMDHPIMVELEVKAHLKQLKGAIEEDSAILSRMAVAARTILREVKKISNRNALDGNYGKMGQRVSGVADKNMHVDQKF